MKNEVVVLQIERPWINCYTTYSHLLTILQCDERTNEWIFSNFINVFMNKDLIVNSWGEFYHPMQYELTFFDICKWINVQKIRKEAVINSREKLLKYVKNELRNGFYVHLNIDHKYITSFETNYHSHDALVYGIDEIKDIVYVLDVFKKGRYENKELTIKEFVDTVVNCEISIDEDYMKGMICSYKIKDCCDYEYNEENIWKMYGEYLNARVPEYWNLYNNSNKRNIVFGIELYSALKQYINEIHVNEFIDVRPFYFLKDHLVIIKKIMEWLSMNKDSKAIDYKKIINIYEELISYIEEINFTLIFMNKTKKNKKLHVIKKIYVMYELEKSVKDILPFTC